MLFLGQDRPEKSVLVDQPKGIVPHSNSLHRLPNRPTYLPTYLGTILKRARGTTSLPSRKGIKLPILPGLCGFLTIIRVARIVGVSFQVRIVPAVEDPLDLVGLHLSLFFHRLLSPPVKGQFAPYDYCAKRCRRQMYRWE
jgi:hypothetical protein